MKSKFGKILLMTILMVFVVMGLAACDEKDDSKPKTGKTRDGKTTEAPVDGPTDGPTDAPVFTPTPTPTPTPTSTPTPSPTPKLTGHAAEMEPLFGNWVSDDGLALTIHANADNSHVDVTVGSWYSESDGLVQDEGASAILSVTSSNVEPDKKTAAFTITHKASDQDYICNVSALSENGFDMQINHSMTRHYTRTLKTPRAQMDGLTFFRIYQGIWSEKVGYDFILLGYTGADDIFYISFNTYASEWLPSYKITKIVEDPNEGLYLCIDYPITETQTKPRWSRWDLNGAGDLTIKFLDGGGAKTFVKGVTYPGAGNLADPNIYDAGALPDDYATEYLKGYDVAKLKEIWGVYMTSEVAGSQMTFVDSYYGRSITVYYDASGKVTEAKTGK